MYLYTSDGYSYYGMSEEVVIALRTDIGLSTTFITKAQYEAAIPSL